MNIQETIQRDVSGQTLYDINRRLVCTINNIAENGIQVGYVAGPITADGPLNISRNVTRLVRWTRTMQDVYPDISMFCAPYVFEKLWPQLREQRVPESDYKWFWDKTLSCAKIGHVFFTPRWEISSGCQAERAMCMRIPNLKIYDIAINETISPAHY